MYFNFFSGFDIVKLNTIVDFYLINSFLYNECAFVENEPPVVTSTVQNLVKDFEICY